MKVDIKLLKEIYMRLADEKSKEMFKNRLLYSITNDTRWIFENLKLFSEGKRFVEKLDQCATLGKLVIFGAGLRGRALHHTFSKYPWRSFIDNFCDLGMVQGLPVVLYDEFVKKYDGEYIFITPKLENELLCHQLIDEGIPPEKVINVGKIQNELLKKQYFDLEYLRPAEVCGESEEIFVDVGGYDGMTSVHFGQWCQKNGYSYIFEPDVDNINKCNENMVKESSIGYRIIPKGAWSEETILHFQANADVSSQIHATGNSVIQVTTIDKELADKRPSFIKMDIEGSELHALRGAQKIISTYRPRLAISIYHKPQDIWEIPGTILEYNSSYKFYLRHYTLTDSDTILYAVP